MHKAVTVILAILLLIFYANMSDTIKKQESKINEYSNKISDLTNRLEEMERDNRFNNFFSKLEEIAYLTPGSNGYSVIQSDIGKLTVSLENILPYANGSRVILRFGNLTTATINGAKAKLEWGSVDKYGSPDNNNAKSMEITFSKSLEKGSWTKVSVVLEGVPPSDLGFVRVREMTHTGITLLGN